MDLHPEYQAMKRQPWQFFGTLTFQSEQLPERVRLAMWFATFRIIAAWFRVHATRDLVWMLRIERGETFGRLHFHYLLSGVPAKSASIGTCYRIVSSTFEPGGSVWNVRKQAYGRWKVTGAWARVGGGFGQCRLFDPHQGGEAYLAGFADLTRPLEGADLYESTKFVMGTCELMPSKSFVRKGIARAWAYTNRQDSATPRCQAKDLVVTGADLSENVKN